MTVRITKKACLPLPLYVRGNKLNCKNKKTSLLGTSVFKLNKIFKLSDDLLFTSLARLTRLAPHVADEGMRLTLLICCWKQEN